MDHAIDSVECACTSVGIAEIAAHLRNVEVTVTTLHHGDLFASSD
jgi:hypothetical protein